MAALSSKALQERDTKYHLHPFTNHDELHAQGTHLVRSGSGVYVEDENGRELLDGLTGLRCTNVGYNCREIIDAVHEQMSKVAFYPSLEHGGYFAHGFTCSGQPTTADAALANLDVIEKENLVARVRDDTGPYFQEKLHSFANQPAVGEARGYGLIGALQLVPREGKAALTPVGPLGNKAVDLIRAEGVIVRGIRDLIALSRPLIITHTEIDQLFDAVGRELDGVWN
jgi:adenosylmethionine-8-amino-7-oxononanoate aminotransferase